MNERKVKGIVIEGSGLGHVSSATISRISELTKKGVFVGITSQCIWGHVDLNVYETGRDMINAGATPLENMIARDCVCKTFMGTGEFRQRKGDNAHQRGRRIHSQDSTSSRLGVLQIVAGKRRS